MLKQLGLILGLSVLSVLLLQQIDTLLQEVLRAYGWFESSLNVVFSGDSVGHLLQMSIALICLPLSIGLVIGMIYYAIKRSKMPKIEYVIWGAWLVVLAVIATQGAA
jgi:hypothetical protein